MAKGAGGGRRSRGRRARLLPRPGPALRQCHRIDGRGGVIGPDLSVIGRSQGRDKLIESILTPSKEIAPAFTTWVITTRDGKVRTGVIVEEGPHSTLTLGEADGKQTVIKRLDVEDRQASPTSLMPDNLHQLMTPGEFRDLLAFLAGRKSTAHEPLSGKNPDRKPTPRPDDCRKAELYLERAEPL